MKQIVAIITLLVIAIIFGCSTTQTPKYPEITPESVSMCVYQVHNRGKAPFNVIKDIVLSLRQSPDEVFAPNDNYDIFSSIKPELGPWTSLKQRAASLGAAMVVQAGFESTWDYTEGRDMSANNTSSCTEEAGMYQTSGNMNDFNKEAQDVLKPYQIHMCGGKATCEEFKACTKEPNVSFTHGHFIRASRITVNHWGPIKRKEINPWLSRACASQIESLL